MGGVTGKTRVQLRGCGTGPEPWPPRLPLVHLLPGDPAPAVVLRTPQGRPLGGPGRRPRQTEAPGCCTNSVSRGLGHGSRSSSARGSCPWRSTVGGGGGGGHRGPFARPPAGGGVAVRAASPRTPPPTSPQTPSPTPSQTPWRTPSRFPAPHPLSGPQSLSLRTRGEPRGATWVSL